jgi:hypothetical protein
LLLESARSLTLFVPRGPLDNREEKQSQQSEK